MRTRIAPLTLIALLVVLPACGLLRGPEPDAPEEPAPPLPQPRTDAPPANDPPAPVTRTLQGYRVQILTTDDKSAADALVGEASQWYASLSSSQRPAYLGGDDLIVEVDWRAPYYRVRIGAFATRAEAERALRAVARRYGDAFIVPDTVTVTR